MEEDAPRWSCGIPKQSIKLLNKIITCIEKFSEDLILDISEDGMVFRAVNKSRSAFSQFKFDSSFFDSFSAPHGSACFLIKAKPCLAIFRSYGNINRCVMSLNEIDCRVVFDLECTFGVKKSHRLTYEDTDTIQCNFMKDTPNRVKCHPKLIGDLLTYFHGNNEEVSLIFDRNRFTVRTYVEMEQLSKDQVVQITRTELVIEPTEFKEYLLEGPGEEIVISLKEAKAVCAFAEALGQPIALHFQKAGKPMMFYMKYYNFLECDFIMATIGVDDPSAGGETSTSQTTTSSSGTTSTPNPSQNTPNTPQSSNSSASGTGNVSTSGGVSSDGSYISTLAPPETPAPLTKSHQTNNQQDMLSSSPSSSSSSSQGRTPPTKSRLFVGLGNDSGSDSDSE